MRRRPRALAWGVPDAPAPEHPYRDSLLVYAGLAVIIVVVAWVTGTSIGHAVLIAVVFFGFASAWSMARWHSRLRGEAAQARRRDL
jgi:positive regulator of sigma E activity